MVKSPKGAGAIPHDSPLKKQPIDPATGLPVSQANQNRPTKKVRSKPLDQPASVQERETQMESLLKTIGTEFNYQDEKAQVLAADSELARKRLRIARMKK